MANQAEQQGLKIESAVEPIREGAQVVSGVLGEVEGLVSAIDHGFQVAQHGVDPGELGQLARLARAHNDVGVSAARFDDAGKAVQAIATHVAAGQEVVLGPVGDGLTGEAGQGRDLHPQRMPCIAGADRGDDGHLVGRATTADTWAFAAKVGVVELHVAAQRLLTVALGHGGHQLVVDQPGGAVAGAQLALERQGRQAGLVLADQENRQEPGAQRQLGAVHHRAGRQRGLVPAASTLEELARPVAHHVVLRRRTARADKSIRPAQLNQRCGALLFRAVAAEKLRQRHPGLELHSVHWHGWLSVVNASKPTRGVDHQMSLSELHD